MSPQLNFPTFNPHTEDIDFYQPMEIDVQDIDHLGIIAGIVDEIGWENSNFYKLKLIADYLLLIGNCN